MEKITSILNDLIRINNDRVVGYEKAIEELKDDDTDLKTLFQRQPKQLTKPFSLALTDHSVEATSSNKIRELLLRANIGAAHSFDQKGSSRLSSSMRYIEGRHQVTWQVE